MSWRGYLGDGGASGALARAADREHWPNRKGARFMSTTGTQLKKQAEPQQWSAEELDYIKWMEKTLGREPTEQEINLWMAQAKYIGDL
jgi:hypothetical protein